MIKISRVKSATKADLKNINALLFQLSDSAKPLTLATYRKLLKNTGTCLLVARENGRIVGMGSVIFMHSPLFTAGYLSDVVVDESMRGRGVGKGIVKALVLEAKKAKMDMVELTTRPSRVAANELYKALGFKQRETNVYRMKFK